MVTDGPYAETQEVLAGYWVVECDSFDRATELAAPLTQCPVPAQVAANPVAAVLSASLLLDHLGERGAAAALEAGAVAALPGAAGYSTQALGDRIATAVAGGGSPHRSGGDDAV